MTNSCHFLFTAVTKDELHKPYSFFYKHLPYFDNITIMAQRVGLKRQCQPQCICLHFTLKVMECQQITIINISLVLCRYNSVKMSKYNHRMVEIYDGLKTKT